LPPDLLQAIISRCQGDARVFLSELETLWNYGQQGQVLSELQLEKLSEILGEQKIDFDPNGRDHSIAISGLIKTMRSHQVDKAMGWLSLMLAGSVDINFIARRLMIFASEDVGNADPKALPLAVAAAQAVEKIGLPEARILLSHAVSYLATAPKSRASYEAILNADDWVILRSRAQLFEDLNPESQIKIQEFYSPRSVGYEKNIADFLQKFRSARKPDQL
jgi:putative ATPase